jgi:type IV pilus assembly protein PilC
MPRFSYRAADAQGRITVGRLDALNEADLENQLTRVSLWLISAKEETLRLSPGNAKLSRRQVIGFLFQLEMMVRAGVPILEALADLRAASDSDASRQLAAGLQEKIETGTPLSGAMSAYPGAFSETVVNLIRAGEVSGQLPDVLREIVRSLRWQDELASSTKKLVMYPAFVCVVIGAVVVFMMVYLVPQLTSFLKNMGQALPMHTKLLIATSDIVVAYWWALLLAPVLLGSGFFAWMRRSEPARRRVHGWLLRLPLLGDVLTKMALARFANSLALMYRTGIPLIDALEQCRNISNNLVIRESIERARERVMAGTPMSVSFSAESLFPPLVIRMLRMGEATGALDQALENVNYFYSRDIDESIQRVQALLEPALTLVMGFILGWIMLAVLGPIYDTITQIKA